MTRSLSQRQAFVLAMAMASALVLDCGGPSPEAHESPRSTDTEETRDPIVHGRRDSNHEAVGLVGATNALDDTTVAWICTGTLIGPRTVLTAAHCVTSEDASRTRPAADMRFSLEGDVFRVRRVRVAPGYSRQSPLGWDDAALLILATRSESPPIAIATDAPFEGQSAVVVGYGVTRVSTEGLTSGAGTRRRAPITLGTITDRELTYDGSAHAACYGDSGGPIFRGRGRSQVIIGITSRGADPTCSGLEVATRVDVLADWIHTHTD